MFYKAIFILIKFNSFLNDFNIDYIVLLTTFDSLKVLS
jgi:hypothetical protein